jgi:hypothetical protein
MANLGLSAFMPHYNRLAASGAQAYKGGVTGRPGTAAIPVQARQNSVPSPDPGDLAQMGLSRSSDAPDAFWPNQYWVTTDPVWDRAGGTAQVQVFNTTRPQDTTMIPVPAVDLRGVYQARSAKLAGGVDNSRRGALKQATSFIRWPRRRVGNGSDQ